MARDKYRPLNRLIYEGPPDKEKEPGQEVPESDPDTTVTPEETEAEDNSKNETGGEPVRSED